MVHQRLVCNSPVGTQYLNERMLKPIQQVFTEHPLSARLRDSGKMVTFMDSYILVGTIGNK